MAEEFLESIYQKAILITEFDESLSCLYRKDFPTATKIYNSAITEVEALLPELASMDNNLTVRLMNSAQQIAENWNDPSTASGLISRSLIPLMYEYMSLFTGIDVTEGKYRFQSTDSGFLTISDTEAKITYHDTHNPMSEAAVLAENIYNPTNREIHILGADLGYLPYMLYKKSQGASKIVIYETDDKILDYAGQFGVMSWLPEGILEFVTSDDPLNLARKLLDFINKNEKSLIERSVSVHISNWKVREYQTLGTDIIDKQSQILAFNRDKYRTCVINMMKNYSRPHISFEELRKKGYQDEWIVIAAGPSLDETITFIKESLGAKSTVAVNTVIRRLPKEGITPDLFVAADPRVQLLDHLRDCESNTRDIPLIADETTCWEFIEGYQGDVCLVPTPNGDCLPLSNPEKSAIWEISGTVVTLGIEAALRLGAKRIYLVGLDLAYPGGISYANGVSQIREENKKGNSTVKSVDGTIVESCQAFDMFRQIIEKQIEKHPEVDFINMSQHGALIKGARKYESC